MRPTRTLPPFALVAVLLLSVAPANAEVTWDHVLTDPADDVISVLEPNVQLSDRGEVDILSASVTGQDDDINVTLSLAGPRSTDGNYEVSITCDGDDAKEYQFTYSFGVFSITGFDLVVNDPEAYLSPDQRTISWVVGQDMISAEERVEVSHAQAMVFSGMTNFIDTAPDGGNGGNGGNGGGTGDPVSVQARIELVKVEHVRYTIEVTVEGDDAKALRGEFDLDVDGTVTRAEYDQHIDFFYLEYASWNTTDIELDGDAPTSRAMTFQFQGIVGSAASTSPVNRVVVLDVQFPEPEEAGTHTYADFLSSSERAGEMWHVTPDSLWTMSAPTGWKFKTDDWPGGARTYLGGKGTTLTLSGLQMQNDWNDTVGVMTSLVITEKADPAEEDTPGPGAMMSLTGLLAASALVVLGRRRR